MPPETVSLPTWLEQVRQVEVVQPLLDDQRTTGRDPLNIDKATARHLLKYGQADFNQPQGHLTPGDLALLYAYWNQKRHLEELFTAFHQLFGDSALIRPIVLDLGCGPFTGGLALLAALGDDANIDYVGVDRALSMRQLGEQIATSEKMPGSVTSYFVPDISEFDWPYHRSWREVVVIISYLFASSTIDVSLLAEQLFSLLDDFGQGGVTVLYTNATSVEANLKLAPFQEKLESAGFETHVPATNGEVRVERWRGTTTHALKYAVFRRPPRMIHALTI